MERAYISDRFTWTSLGFDGLNGRAKFPQINDARRPLAKTLRAVFEALEKDLPKPRRDYGASPRRRCALGNLDYKLG